MNEIEKKYLRVFLSLPDGENVMDHFDFNRNDAYTTNADAGYEDLDLQKDIGKIMLYMQNDILRYNNGRKYKVLGREFQPCRPTTLFLTVEEIK